MTLKLVTLNIEGSKHLDRVIPFLKKENPDAICLQEVFLIDFNKICAELSTGGKFFPMSNATKVSKYKIAANGQWGVALLTKTPKTSIEPYYYRGNGTSPEFTDAVMTDKVLVYGDIQNNGKVYTIATTHFTWTPDGKPTQEQWEDFHKLISFLKPLENVILCGDFNAPRGREIFTEFTKYFKDNLPTNITSTIDPKYHRVPGLHLAVDTIFSKGYSVNNVRVVDGISDHKALVAEIDQL